MAAFQVNDSIYSVGVLNPNLRVFDIIMKTEFGTSYNAYLIKAEKNVLIETVHIRFFDEYIENIQSVLPLDQIDYLILNHTEPDHSGSVRKLLELAPQIQIVSSMAANKYLQGITNTTFDGKIVKDKDQLDIGGKTLEFHIAPFLHWPDSMFTYIAQDKVLFTCDFLGAHYCEPRMLDANISYPENYRQEFDNYYAAIFSPFKEHVLKGLDKADALDVETACPSHGPILTKAGYEKAKALYRKYSTPRVHAKKLAPVFYVSAYGATAEAAEAVAQKAQEMGFESQAHNIIYCDQVQLAKEINEADALFIGSPTINKDALKPVWDLIACVDAIGCKGKPAFVFGSYGWSGEAVPMLCERLKGLKMKVFENGYKFNFIPSEAEISAVVSAAEEFLRTV